MNSHNSESLVGGKSISIRLRASREKSDRDSELTIADDPDLGCDPYNSTGRHVIMTTKIELED